MSNNSPIKAHKVDDFLPSLTGLPYGLSPLHSVNVIVVCLLQEQFSLKVKVCVVSLHGARNIDLYRIKRAHE